MRQGGGGWRGARDLAIFMFYPGTQNAKTIPYFPAVARCSEPGKTASMSDEQRGTSRDYLIRKLKEAGRNDLVAAIENKQVSAFACAEALGWRKRQPIQGTGSPNAAKRRAWALHKLGL